MRKQVYKACAILLTLMLALHPLTTWACTQIYFGSETTESGDVYIGRSEDIQPRRLKEFGIEPAAASKTYWGADSGPVQDPLVNFTRTSPGPTYRYTYVRDLPVDWEGAPEPYSETGINEVGVSVDATLSTGVNQQINDVDPMVQTGLGEYNMADVVLGEASSAREGVEILGAIIDAQGSREANQLWIADATEAWCFQQLSGHQWIAVRADANVVSINPNISNLQFPMNLDDAQSCLHSAGIIQTAIDAGTLTLNEDGFLNVARSYGLEEETFGKMTRYVQGWLYLGEALEPGVDYALDDTGDVAALANPRLFHQPPRAGYTLLDAMHLLATRGEGTPVDANANNSPVAIGNTITCECHLLQVREGFDPQMATVQWTSLSPGEFALYIPSYSALLTSVDGVLYPDANGFDEQHALHEADFDVEDDSLVVAKGEQQALEGTSNGAMNHLLMDLNTLAANHRAEVGEGVHAHLNALQTQVIAQQDEVDAMMRELPAGEARNAFANEAHAVVSRQVYESCSVLLSEVRAYVVAGDYSAPFASPEVTAEGGLANPLRYAEAMREYAPSDEAVVESPTESESRLSDVQVCILCAVITVAEIALALALHRLNTRHKNWR
ncbi:MAG: C69 family dipeptidase [Atopobiaceae bacterium]|nr:C69 family dipeptidase [Atopobiaceae bacterium]